MVIRQINRHLSPNYIWSNHWFTLFPWTTLKLYRHLPNLYRALIGPNPGQSWSHFMKCSYCTYQDWVLGYSNHFGHHIPVFCALLITIVRTDILFGRKWYRAHSFRGLWWHWKWLLRRRDVQRRRPSINFKLFKLYMRDQLCTAN